MNKDVYVIGHKNPDTDSIASAIAYSKLKNQTGHHNYIAARCGNVSSETQYVLERFHQKEPKFVGDVRTQVRDMDMRKIPGVAEEMSLRDAWSTMKENKVVSLCITEDTHLKGLITTGDLVDSYMGSYDANTLSQAKTTYTNIVDTLDGTLIVGDISDSQI